MSTSIYVPNMEFTHHIHYDKDSGYRVPPEEDA